MKIVYLEWKDAFSQSGWVDKDALNKEVINYDMWTETTGFLIKRTKEFIIVCATHQKAEPSIGVKEKYCTIHKIPKTWIRNYKVIGNKP